MLKGQELGQAITRAMQLKGIGPSVLARHFGVKSPSVYDWTKHGRIAKDKLPELFRYFSDVVGPEHWGLTDGWLDQPPGERSDAASSDLTSSASKIAQAFVRDVLILSSSGELTDQKIKAARQLLFDDPGGGNLKKRLKDAQSSNR